LARSIKIEVSFDLHYCPRMSLAVSATESRRGARRMSEVPSPVLARLEAGDCETVNLMEWLATDMGVLARVVAASVSSRALADALRAAAAEMAGSGVTTRLRLAGGAIASATPLDSDDFRVLATHQSDLVRQWACYAVSDPRLALQPAERLARTLEFAGDRNMSVREAAWMAYRPHIVADIEDAISRLATLASHENENLRRFAVEITRPRSVWGAHIERLKRDPKLGLPILEPVRQDSSRYVRLAVGNWLNDASKSRSDWVRELCDRWSADPSPHVDMIIRRGMRTLSREKGNPLALL
jgi:3-methyladenine DNA glycosylase AlkC